MSSSPRVLLVVEQLRRRVPGGIGTMIHGILEGLALLRSEDHAGSFPEVTLYASRVLGGNDPLRDLGWPFLASKLPGPLMVRAWDRGLLDVPKGFDAVHATSFAAPRGRTGKLVVTVHDLTWRRFPEAFPRRGKRWHEAALQRAVRSASALVVPSESVASDLASAGAPPYLTRVIPSGCDHLPAPDFEALQQLLGPLGVEGEYLLSVGTLEPRKNLSRLLEAYSRVREDLPDRWPLVVVGPEGWGPGIVARPGVVLAGQVDDATLAALYRRARLLAYVPLAEGYGFPPLEAMREGIPVVASKVPSAGSAALEVDPLSVEDIAAALSSAATDEDVRQRLTSAGRAHCAPITWANAARSYVDLWESLS